MNCSIREAGENKMILADKIIELRKKEGWSQEQLAGELGVSRQAISKWESKQAIPDMSKILAMSKLFGVSTDYLLKDEICQPEDAPEISVPEETVGDKGEILTPVSMDLANEYLELNKRDSVKVSVGVLLCILSPVLLILMLGASDAGMIPMSEDQVSFIGIIILMIFVGIAVALFIPAGMHDDKYKFITEQSIDTAYGVDGMVSERNKAFEHEHTASIVIGVTLCVIAVIPMLITAFISESGYGGDFIVLTGTAILLVFVAVGVYIIVRVSIIWGGYQVLLEEGDYTRENKKCTRKIGNIYWGIILAVYLLISFLTMRWDITWVIWPVAGVLYGVISQVVK